MKVSKLIFAMTKIGLSFALTGWSIASTFKSQPVAAAEKITFPLSVLGEFQISVEDLAVFAENGTVTPEFANYANRLDEKTLRQLRQILQISFDVKPITVYRVTNMPMGEDFLKRLGNIIYTHPQRNGFYAIRAALIQAAGEPEGLTTIGFLRHFPAKEIQLNTDSILAIAKEAESFFKYKDTTVKAIAQQAQSNSRITCDSSLCLRLSANDTDVPSSRSGVGRSLKIKSDFAKKPDLRKPGQHQVTKKTSIFPINDLRQTASGFAGAYDLNVDIYAPQTLDKSAPLAIIAHGLGSQRSDYDYLAEHLASHGYIVAIPEHAGSSNNYQKAFLRGEVNVDVSPVEFYSRPRDITHLLDSLEQHPDYQTQINWSQVGILGHSFGGTTSLIASGAPINVARIKNVCQSDYEVSRRHRFTLNVSLFLQCRASNLPPGNYDLQDERIKAVAALNPVTSSVLGIESMSQIDIPTLIVGGTMDFVSPYIEEQVHPFLWLTTPNKY
ncbi:MAG: alpha/beta hydrolase [Pleurocapsa sp.]